MMQGFGDQTDVIRLLSDPTTHGGEAVQRIDTHASVVFLAGSRALKLKRAVKYDYLDFSTIDARRRCCDAELRINRRLAPTLYRRVLPIVRTSGGALALGGNGTPVDWVVEMTRFDQAALFDALAAAGRLDLSLMTPLAEEIAAVHDGSEPRPALGGEAGIRRVIEGNDVGVRAFGADTLARAAAEALTGSARQWLRRCGSLLESRRLSGSVRQCHGDLHLGNIVLLDGRPTLFDAIEFNEDLACVDVMYDLAFLLMDLWHRGLRSHANALLNAYLAATQDIAALTALPLFLSCRAAIRAKTTATAAALQSSLEGQRQLRVRARQYLDLATRVLTVPGAAIVAVGGLSGSGKSTVARALAPSIGAVPGAVVLRSDEIRKRLWGAPPLTRLGPAAYSPEMSALVYEALAAGAIAVARSGHTVIVDAVFARSEDRLALERAARAAAIPFAAVWLEAPEGVLVERVARRELDASDADPGVVRMQCAQWADDVRWPRVDAAGDLETVAADAGALLQTELLAVGAAA
jgi:aminoglycoside phosphotransferase family enzyme/predicted kinase